MKHRAFLAGLLVLAVVIPATTPYAGEKMPVTTTSDEAMKQYLQGRELTEKLRFPDARPYFEKAVELDPNFAMAYFNLASSQGNSKAFFEMIEKAKTAMVHASAAEQKQITAAEAGFTGDPATQLLLLMELAEEFPNDERARNSLGNVYFGRQQLNQAIEQYEAVIQIAPNFSPVYNQLGYSYRFQGKNDQAEQTFKKYIELIPNDPNPYDSYAELLLKMGRYEDAIAQYEKAVALQNTFAASYGGIATCYNHLGDYEAARMTAHKLHEVAVNDGQRRTALFFEAVSHTDEGDLESAIAAVEREFDVAEANNDPTNMAADLSLIGTLLIEAGRPAEALEKFKQGMALVDASSLSDRSKANTRLNHHYNVGRATLALGDIAAASEHQKELAKVAGQKQNRFQIWLAHELAGMIAMEAQDYKTVIAELEQGNPQNAYNLYRMAVASEKMGDHERARALCDQVAEYNVVSNINYALVRKRAQRMLDAM